jgi:hypothetical protein
MFPISCFFPSFPNPENPVNRGTYFISTYFILSPDRCPSKQSLIYDIFPALYENRKFPRPEGTAQAGSD